MVITHWSRIHYEHYPGYILFVVPYTAAPRPGIRVADFERETDSAIFHVARPDTRFQSGNPKNACRPRSQYRHRFRFPPLMPVLPYLR